MNAQGRYAEAQRLYEKALEIDRRLLTDDDVGTATDYNNLGMNLDSQGKYAEAQPLYEKALEIKPPAAQRRPRKPGKHYNNIGMNLYSQGKYAVANRSARNRSKSTAAS